MDLKEFDFPKYDTYTQADIAFSTLKTDPKLLEEAKERGFYGGRTQYNTLFGEIFYNGGKIKWKEGVEEEFRKNVYLYFKCLIRSFDPKHEEKEAICAMLLSEIVEPELDKA